MFAYLATRDPDCASRYTSELHELAKQYDVPSPLVRTLTLPNFQLDFFDDGEELQHFVDERYVVLLAGVILNRRGLATEFGVTAENDAQLVLEIFRNRRGDLARIDGHLSVVLYDALSGSFFLLGDRFLRYSVVFSIDRLTQVSSHTRLLYPFLSTSGIDREALSQSIHFRWLTGTRRLCSGVNQVLAGSLTHIDRCGEVRTEAYAKLVFRRESNVDCNYWANEVDRALDNALAAIAAKHDVIGIPLSGGVDSSLLLAKAKEHFKSCIAVTGRFQSGSNPELENARKVASYLGVRHVIAEIDDEYVRKRFPEIVRLHEQPLRNYSDIALAKVLGEIKSETDAFLYGEAADTFFGINAVHRIARASDATALFRRLPPDVQKLVSMIVPERSGRLADIKAILADGVGAMVRSMERIRHLTPPSKLFPEVNEVTADKAFEEFLGHESFEILDRASVQLLSTGVMNHIENTGRLATQLNLRMYVPFVLNDLRSVALRLPIELQRDDGEYKKVLKELACRFLPTEFVYTEKHGFPTPEKEWLDGPLQERVWSSIGGNGFGSQYYRFESLTRLSPDTDFEHFWFVICLDELLYYLNGFSSRELAVA